MSNDMHALVLCIVQESYCLHERAPNVLVHLQKRTSLGPPAAKHKL